MAKTQTKPIELYYWPTPNGYKVSIMLEECRLPYRVVPLNIAQGDQFVEGADFARRGHRLSGTPMRCGTSVSL